jgi:hypothetical protein
MPGLVDESSLPAHLQLLQEPRLTLADVAELVPDARRRPEEGLDPFSSAPQEWGSYYQAMVRKTASTQDGSFRFNAEGAFAPRSQHAACESLCGWLGLDRRRHSVEIKAIRDWLRNGTPLGSRLFWRLRDKLKSEMLAETDLYNRPICRLVQVDQLRYDPDYTAVYQLTPAQVRLISDQEGAAEEPAANVALSPLARIHQNQRLYWTISEHFQSAIALFDSDLGSTKFSEQGTKNLLHIHERKEGGGGIAPHALNQYSPLRFWSPPPTFARYVFHMLFWQPVVTGRDLYKRVFPDDTTARIARFRVAINGYNAAKYRIADYAGLLRLLEELTDAFAEHPRRAMLANLKDIQLKHPVFYPREFEHPQLVRLPSGDVRIPLRSLNAQTWELTSRYHGRSKATTVGHMFQMLRDRVLEILLWSKYQMEIRSVGMVPVQRVYQVELENEGLTFVERLQALHKQERYDELDDEFSSAVFSGDLENWVVLRKEYDREISRLLMRETTDIKWLETKEQSDEPRR